MVVAGRQGHMATDWFESQKEELIWTAVAIKTK